MSTFTSSFGGVVLYATHERAPVTAFYEALGLTFQAHQHGAGKPHDCHETPPHSPYPPILEIYGASKRRERTHAVLVTVSDLDEALRRVDATSWAEIKVSGSSRQAMVMDPDGRAVLLFEPVRE